MFLLAHLVQSSSLPVFAIQPFSAGSGLSLTIRSTAFGYGCGPSCFSGEACACLSWPPSSYRSGYSSASVWDSSSERHSRHRSPLCLDGWSSWCRSRFGSSPASGVSSIRTSRSLHHSTMAPLCTLLLNPPVADNLLLWLPMAPLLSASVPICLLMPGGTLLRTGFVKNCRSPSSAGSRSGTSDLRLNRSSSVVSRDSRSPALMFFRCVPCLQAPPGLDLALDLVALMRICRRSIFLSKL